ncbi:extracellular serine-rich [Lentinula edodes]|uniref:Extracellular serine-rich n=1 Tax=Lentinula edodes TaxID=5353 RepID=A0A1Q3E553_LENED|nr:extracellular serine-rich [Lentinula edodes]
MMIDSTSTMMMESSSIMMTETAAATSVTTTAAMSYSTPSYGSGSSSWGSSGYDGCVQQCIASFGTPATYAPTATSGSSGSTGTGSTITVVVAPTQGVLRYVPFAVNASVGDTIKFMWGANNHTVTKSSELTPCNKTSDAPFASGEQNQSFVFTQVVNDTNPTFFYCGTPTHCEKGMFGIINPPSALDAPTSVAGMMSSVVSNDTSGNLATYASYTSNQTSGSAGANWGANIDMSNMPSWAYDAVVENVMFTRNVLAMNPDIMNADGSVNLASIGSTPMMVPPDVGSALNAASSPSSDSSSTSTASSVASSSASSASSTSSPVGASSTNGAMSVTSSKALVGAVVLAVTFFAL